MANHFYDLTIWKDAHSLALDIYKVTEKFPREERYGVIDQIRRSSSSVSANIAEGSGRYHFADKIRFCMIARGSAHETQNFILLARDIGYLDEKAGNSFLKRYDILVRQINAFISHLKEKSSAEALSKTN